MAADGRVGLVFSISANTQMGESLRIVGEVEELGKWNPDKSVELYTDGKSYPTWSTAEPCWIRMKPGKKRLEYKYLRDRRQLGEGYVWEDAIPNRCLNVPAGGLWVASDRLWDCPGELKLRPGSRNSSFESRRNLVQALDCDAVAEHLFTPTQRTPEPPATPPVRRGSSSHIESPASPPGKLQREASASILCRQASELKKDSSQAQLFRENSGSCLAAEEEEVTVQRSFDAAYMLLGDEPLGEGSFGLVWRCLSRADAAGGSEERAAKRIAKARLAPRDVRNLFGDGHLEGEIKMHLGLTHAHIVGLFEVFQDDDVVSLVMECCNGGDLFDLIAKHADQGGLAEHCAARVQVHLLSALDFLHSQPVVHRDVKCENVLLAQQGVPPEQNVFKLCDFGFAARPRAPLYRLNTRMGSPDTVAPEVVRGEPYWTPVDCWAAGVLLYMSLSATPPFYAQSDAEVLQKVHHCIYKLEGKRWDFVSPDAKQLIRRLMKFEASSRATATQALSHSFLQEAQQSA